MGTVERVFVAGAGGEPMQAVDEVQAVAGRGLEGDRYATRRGYWTDVDECQVTLIRAEDLDAIATSAGVQVNDGEHRRNIVTRESNCGGWPGGPSASAGRRSPTTGPGRRAATSRASPNRG